MRKKFLAGVLCGFAVLTQSRAQEVEVPRESRANVATSATLPEQPKAQIRGEQTNISQSHDLTAEQMRKAGSLAAERVKAICVNGEMTILIFGLHTWERAGATEKIDK